MTVNELLQRLVELAADGKAQWEVKHFMGCHCSSCSQEIIDVGYDDETKEVVIE